MHSTAENAHEDHGYDDHHDDDLPVPSLRLAPESPLEADYRRQVAHDIRHELSTIMLLASVLTGSSDVGPESRHRLQLLRDETAWLHELITVFEPDADRADRSGGHDAEIPVIRLDQLVDATAQPARIVTDTELVVDSMEISVRAHPLSLWRVLRNLLGNALAAAGPDGQVTIRLARADGFAVLEVEDDGPGISGLTAMRLKDPYKYGLKIVAQLLDDYDGSIEFVEGRNGGCLARLRIPAVAEDAAG
jgi:K+-sensing histidine kinase KdpD